MNLPAFEFQSNFTVWDWGLVGGFLLITVAVGVFARRRVANLTDFILAGRTLKPELGVVTVVATEIGLVSVMYSAQKGFSHGFSAFHIGLAAGAGMLFVGLTGLVVVPLRKMGVMTIPEFYERRFGRGVRVVGGGVLATAGILKMAILLQVGTLFLMGLTGVRDPLTLKLTMTVVLMLVLLYTVLGGMVSVLVTDYLQFIVLSLALLATCMLALQVVDMDRVYVHLDHVRKEPGVNPFHADGFGAEYVVWMVVLGLISAAAWPPSVMRACAAKSTRVVRQIYSFSAVGILVGAVVPCFLGVYAMTYFDPACPALRDAALGKVFTPGASQQTSLLAMPVALSQVLPAGVIGLVAAGMLAALMSTQDSGLLCCGAVLAQDVIAPCLRGGLSDHGRLRLTRLLILGIGVILLAWGLWHPWTQSLWDLLAVTGTVYFTGAFSLLVMGIYWRRASRFGAHLALACGALALLGLEPVQQCVGLEISATRAALAAAGASMAAMVLGSILVPDRRRAPADPQTPAAGDPPETEE